MNISRLPKMPELENSVLSALKSKENSSTNQEILDFVVSDLSIPSQLQAQIHSGQRTELEYRFAWARTNLVKHNRIERIAPKTWIVKSE
jgi:hypothetical protein